jgi:PAS domain S-box-containing protein
LFTDNRITEGLRGGKQFMLKNAIYINILKIISQHYTKSEQLISDLDRLVFQPSGIHHYILAILENKSDLTFYKNTFPQPLFEEIQAFLIKKNKQRLHPNSLSDQILIESNNIFIFYSFVHLSTILVMVLNLNNFDSGRIREMEETFTYLSKNLQNKLKTEYLPGNKSQVQKIFKKLHEVYFRFDLEGKLLYISPNIAEVIGYVPDELILKPIHEIFVINDMEKHQFLYKILDTGSVHNFITSINGKKGQIHVHVEAFLEYNEQGEPAWIEGSLRDISSLFIDTSPTHKNELYSIILEQSHDAVYLYKGTKFLYINPIVSELTGYSPQELYNMNIFDLIHPDDRERLYTYGMNRFRGRPAPNRYIAKVVCKDGEIRYCDFHVTDVMYKGEKAVVGSVRDITDIIEHQKNLKQQKELFQDLLYAQPYPVLVLNSTFQPLYYNPLFKKQFVLKDEKEIIVTDSIPNLISEIKNSLSENQRLIFSSKLRTKYGSERIYDIYTYQHVIKQREEIYYILSFIDMTEHQFVLNKLHENEERYRKFFQFDISGHFISTIDGEFIDCNSAFLKIFGIPSKEWLAEHNAYSFYLSEKDRINFIEELKQKKILINKRMKLKRMDGSPVYITENVVGEFNPEGELIRFYGYVNDITQQVQTEQSLQEYQKHLESIFTAAPMGILLTDMDGAIIDCNPAFVKLHGFDSKAELIGKNGFDLVAEEHKQKAREIFSKILEEQYIISEEIISLTKQGTKIIAQVSAALIHDESGNPTRILTLSQDISQLKEKEEQIRTLSFAIDQSPFPILIYNSDQKIIYCNRKFSKLFAYQNNEIIGEHRSVLYSEILPLHVKKNLEDALHMNEIFEAEMIYKTKYNLDLTIRTIITPIFDDHHQASYYVEFMEDITSQKKLQKEKEELEKMIRVKQKLETIGTLAGGIAHDFNNIITPILGYADAIKLMAQDNAKLSNYASKIIKASKRAKEMIDQILKFSKKHEQHEKPVYLQDVIKELVQFLRHSIPSTFQIQTNISETCSPVLGDSTQLYQVLLNLATNAVQAMEPVGHGILTITLDEVENSMELSALMNDRKVGKLARITVTDEGIGIPEEILDRVFEPFFTTKDPGKGTGLGLSIVYGIIQNHKGYIKVNSKVNQGTTFEIYLPVIKVSVEDSDQESIPVAVTHGNIVVVDDEKEITELLYETLQIIGYNVIPFNFSTEALEYIQLHHHEIDLVITDLTMPGMTGNQLSLEIKKLNPTLPVILITGYRAKLSDTAMKESRIDSVLMKPISLKDLLSEISILLKKIKA